MPLASSFPHTSTAALSSTDKSGQAANSVDWGALRQDFPVLSQLIHGQPLANLDDAATSQKPKTREGMSCH